MLEKMDHNSITRHLNPLQGKDSGDTHAPTGRKRGGAGGGDSGGGDSDARVAKLLAANKQLENQVKNLRLKQQSGGGATGKALPGPGKVKQPRARARTAGGALPLGLREGCEARKPNAKACCFDYNLAHGCDKAVPGAACPKGFHLCMRIGCTATHSQVNHA